MPPRILRDPLQVLLEQRLRCPELLLRHAQSREIEQNRITRRRGVLEWRKNALCRREISTIQSLRSCVGRRARLGKRHSRQAKECERQSHGSATFKIWSAAMSRSVCTLPLGQRSSISRMRVSAPTPKWTLLSDELA